MSIEKIIDKHTQAYRDKDMDAFVATCHDDIKIIDFKTGDILIDGKSMMRERYADTFTHSKNLEIDALNKIIEGNMVIVHVHIRGHYKDDDLRGIEMYEVENGLISRKWLLFQ